MFFALQVPGVRMYSDFADLLPQGTLYQVAQSDPGQFYGANNIILSLEVKRGDVFADDVLKRIDRLTQKIDQLPGVNHNTVASITHRTVRKGVVDGDGRRELAPCFDGQKTQWSAAELAQMREDMGQSRVYGLLVSPDLKAVLIKATFNEGELDYRAIFDQVRTIREQESDEAVNLYVTGQPTLVGWVYTYVEQILQVFLYTALI